MQQEPYQQVSPEIQQEVSPEIEQEIATFDSLTQTYIQGFFNVIARTNLGNKAYNALSGSSNPQKREQQIRQALQFVSTQPMGTLGNYGIRDSLITWGTSTAPSMYNAAKSSFSNMGARFGFTRSKGGKKNRRKTRKTRKNKIH